MRREQGHAVKYIACCAKEMFFAHSPAFLGRPFFRLLEIT